PGQVRGGGRGRLAGVGLGAGIHASTVDRRGGYLPPTGVTTAGGGEHDHRHCTHDRGHGSRSPGAAYGGGVTQPVCDAPLIRRLLPPLQALSLVCLLFATLGALADSGPWSSAGPMVAVLYGSAIPVVALLWVARSRVGTARGRAVLTVLVAIVLIPVAVFGSMGFTIPVLLTAVALMVVDVGRATGLLTTLAVGAAVVILRVSSDSGLLGVGIALDSALNAYEQAHARDRRTIAERDQALAQLEEAITQLRHTAEIEKELLLADERTRSARDLHDGLGHRLTLISMSLEFAQRSREIDPDAAWSEVATAETTAREALSEMRTWVRALSPVRDRDATGAAAFEA